MYVPAVRIRRIVFTFVLVECYLRFFARCLIRRHETRNWMRPATCHAWLMMTQTWNCRSPCGFQTAPLSTTLAPWKLITRVTALRAATAPRNEDDAPTRRFTTLCNGKAVGIVDPLVPLSRPPNCCYLGDSSCVTGKPEATSGLPTNRELAAPETSPPIFRSGFQDVRFLRRHATGRTCNTFHQQYGDIILVEFRVH